MTREDIENVLEPIKNEFIDLISENSRLREENKELQSEHYKDEEIKRLDELLSESRTRSRHYGLAEKDYNKLMTWWDNHLNSTHAREVNEDKKGMYKMSRKPSYHIEINEFAECTCYFIKCNGCGKSENVYY